MALNNVTKAVHRLVVDLNERGWFKAHVEDHSGREVFCYSNEDENGLPSEDGLWIVLDGFLRHATDLAGLKEYLVSLGIMQADQHLVLDGGL